MQLKMDPSSDQLANAVSGASPTLVMTSSAPESPITLTTVTPTGLDNISVGTGAGITGSTRQATTNGAGNTNRTTNGSLKTVTPTGSQINTSSTQSLITHSPSSQNLPSQPFNSSNQRFNPSNITSPTASMPLRILVLKDLVGAIIGRGGGTIKAITQETHAKVDVHRKEHSTANENVIMIYGTPDACTSACKRILQVMQDESRALNRPDEVILKILASNTVIGRIIGKNGATIKRIMTNTDAKISVNSSNLLSQYNNERTILISGTLEAMSQAESAISAKLRQCYEADIYTHLQYQIHAPYPVPMVPSALLGVPSAPVVFHGPMTALASLPSATHGSAFFMSSHSAVAAARATAGQSHNTVAGSSSASGSVTANQTNVPGSILGASASVAAAAAATAAAQAGTSTSGQQYGPYYPHFSLPQVQSYFPNLPFSTSTATTASHGFYGFGIPPHPSSLPPALPPPPPPPPMPSSSSQQSVIVSAHGHGSATSAQHQQYDNCRETVSLFIPNTVVGAIIGRGGQTVREMMHHSSASIKVAPMSDDDNSPLSSISSPPTPTLPDSVTNSEQQQQVNRPIERRVVITGTPNAQYYAQNMIFYYVICELSNHQQTHYQTQQQQCSKSSQSGIGNLFNGFYGDKTYLRVEILVPTNAVRRIIGRHGSVIQDLQRNTGTTIKFAKERNSSASSSFTPSGSSAIDTTSITSPSSNDQQTSSTSVVSTSSSTVTPSNQTTEDTTPVHIVGDFLSCYMAQRQIRAIVAQATLTGPVTYSAQQNIGGIGKQAADSSASANIKIAAKQSELNSDTHKTDSNNQSN